MTVAVDSGAIGRGGARHTPTTHEAAPPGKSPQRVPQAPQWVTSVRGSTQTPSQRVGEAAGHATSATLASARGGSVDAWGGLPVVGDACGRAHEGYEQRDTTHGALRGRVGADAPASGGGSAGGAAPYVAGGLDEPELDELLAVEGRAQRGGPVVVPGAQPGHRALLVAAGLEV